MYNIVKKAGFEFKFDPNKCSSCEGNCCIGESGYIWATSNEIDDIAEFLKLDREKFVKDFTKKVNYKVSLKELKVGDSFHCIFFDAEKRACQIYPVRPIQCRTFPFWDHFKKNQEEVVKECPGIII